MNQDASGGKDAPSLTESNGVAKPAGQALQVGVLPSEGEVKQEADKASNTANSALSTRSFKDITLGDVGAALDLIKKFWAALVAVALLALGAFLYIAPDSKLKTVDCKVEKRAVADDQRATVLLLRAQQAERSRQEAALLNLKTIMLETAIENKDAQLKFGRLEKRMDELIAEAKKELGNKETELKSANTELDAALKQLKSCGSGS
jgi:hypothetical protein